MIFYYGDFSTSATVHIHFTTHQADNAPVAPSAAFVAADFRVYKNDSTTERTSTSGINVTSPFDSIVGRHRISIDLSDNTDSGFYAAGNDYRVEINSAKTVDGISQSGVAVGVFSIQNRYAGSGGSDATAANQTTILGHLTDIKGSGWSATHALKAIYDHGNSAWITATGFSTPTNITDAQAAILAKLPTTLIAGRIEAYVGAVGNDTLTAAALATDAVAEIQSGLATQSSLSSVATTVNTVVGATNKLNDTLEDDGGTYRFTTNALEQAPTGGGGDATSTNQTTIIDHLTDIKGAGWTSANALNVLATQASVDDVDSGVTAAVSAIGDVDAVINKLDTALEPDGIAGYQFTTLSLENAPAGGGGGDATEANQTTILGHLTDIKGSGWTSGESLKAISDDIANVEATVDAAEVANQILTASQATPVHVDIRKVNNQSVAASTTINFNLLSELVPLTGPHAVSFNITDADTDEPIQHARIRVHRAGFTQTKSTGEDGNSGNFFLDTATWSIIVVAANYTAQATAVAINNDVTLFYQLAPTITPPSIDLDICQTTLPVIDQYGLFLPGVSVRVRFIEFVNETPPPGVVVSVLDPKVSNENGLATFDLLKMARYVASYRVIGQPAKVVAFTTPDDDVYTVVEP